MSYDKKIDQIKIGLSQKFAEEYVKDLKAGTKSGADEKPSIMQAGNNNDKPGLEHS